MKCPHCGKSIYVRGMKRRSRGATWDDVFKFAFNRGALKSTRKRQLRVAHYN